MSSALISNTKPAVLTGTASSLAPGGAILSGSVNPEGKNVTSCFFEYGTSTAYGSTAPCSASPGSGTSPAEVTAAVSGLAERTAYHFRIVANGSAGAEINSYGADASFTTTSSPLAVTGSAAAVTQTSATLGGTVNPNGAAVTGCTLEYGPTSAYGASAPCSPEPGSGEGAVPVSASVTGLAPGTVYHFRVHAENASAVGAGEDESFQTLSAPVTVVSAVPDAELAGTVLTASPSGLIAAKVSCPAAESRGCTGTITLRTTSAVRVGKAKAAVLTLTTGAFRLSGGGSTVVSLRLSAKARTLLARSHTLRVLAIVSAHDSAGASHTAQRTVTVRLAKAPRKH